MRAGSIRGCFDKSSNARRASTILVIPLCTSLQFGIAFLNDFLHLRRGQLLSTINVARPILLNTLSHRSSWPWIPSPPCNTTTTGTFSFGAATVGAAFNLGDVSVAVFTQALQNVATLRAENGGSVSRLQFAKESAGQQRTNLEAANGRIMDVDIARESTQLAKFNILVQASASMLSQANASSNVAMMLLN